jgi:hypothetical protein
MSTNGDSLKRVLPGEPFRPSAAAWNAMLDAARKVAELDASAGRALSATREAARVLVKNTTGTAFETGHIVGLGAPLFTPTDNLGEFMFRPTILGAVPTLASHEGKWGVCAEQIPAGKIGAVIVGGVAPARVNVTAGTASLEGVEVKDGDETQLSLVAGGSARVMWRESGTSGTKWALIRFGPDTAGAPFHARLTGAALLSGKTYRWGYAWTEVVLPAYGSGEDWTTLSGGRSGTTTVNYAVNAVEADNRAPVGATNGFAGLSYRIVTGETFLPLAAGKDVGGNQWGPVVRMSRTASGRYVFEGENTIDGSCP